MNLLAAKTDLYLARCITHSLIHFVRLGQGRTFLEIGTQDLALQYILTSPCLHKNNFRATLKINFGISFSSQGLDNPHFCPPVVDCYGTFQNALS